MASDSKKSNQAAGEGKQHCSRAHWLAVLGTIRTLEVPEDWWRGAKYEASTVKDACLNLRIELEEMPCTCIDCQRHPRRAEDGNPHEGKVML